MTKSELITRITDRLFDYDSHLTVKDAEKIVKLVIDAMSNGLANGQRIEIRGFGSFDLNYRPSRVGRNPKLGCSVTVPEKFVPHFKAGKDLRERVLLGIKKASV